MTNSQTIGVDELIGRLHRALSMRFISALKEAGFDDVTPAFAAIMPLVEEHGSRQSEMAKRAGMTKQAVGQLVKELAVRDYVRLDVDPTNGRARLVRFTPRGLALRECGFELKRVIVRDIERSLSPGQLDQLSSSLQIVLATTGPLLKRDS